MKMKQWMLAAILTISSPFVLTSCSEDDGSTPVPDLVEKQLKQMTLREKVGQMFYVRLESLDPTLTRAFAAF